MFRNKGTLLGFSLCIMCLLVLSPFLSWRSTAAGPTFQTGDVFLNVGSQGSHSDILWFRPVGNTCPVPTCLVSALNPGVSGEGDGMAFDSSGNLYATEGFAADTIVKFDTSGSLVGTFFTNLQNGEPESLVFSNTGNVFVGNPDSPSLSAGARIDELSSSGSLVQSFGVNNQNRGSDWVDLASNQCTIYYTSEGNEILNYNICTQTQGTPITIQSTSIGTCYAHRIIPSGTYAGDDLVACSNQVVLVDSSGNVLQTYLTGSSILFALNLDPSGTSFWTADYFSGAVYKVDIASGSVLLQFNVNDFGYSANPLGGVAVFGEITAATSSSTTTTNGVPQFGPGLSSVLIAAVAFAGMTVMLRYKRPTQSPL